MESRYLFFVILILSSWLVSLILFKSLVLDAENDSSKNLIATSIIFLKDKHTTNKKVERLGEYVLVTDMPTEKQIVGNNGHSTTKRYKARNPSVILMWTNYYEVHGEKLMNLILSGRKWDSSCCSRNESIVTLNRSMLPKATAVVFFNWPHNLDKKDLPKRYPGQLWVLFCKESPAYPYLVDLEPFNDNFNWTMTYRRDSDIYAPYGFTRELAKPIPSNKPILMPGGIPLSKWIENKTEILASVVSNCKTQSKRERISKALRESSLPVHIYGKCGERKICPRLIVNGTCDDNKFWISVGEKYKFYFAAENAICVDYISEKFWRTLEVGMVPLVYGGANYTAVAPPNSFIDVAQFKSPAEIAAYLKKVSNDSEEYAKYFEWKRKYEVASPNGWAGWCTLCRLVKQYNRDPKKVNVPPKRYTNLKSWWFMKQKESNNSACTLPPFP